MKFLKTASIIASLLLTLTAASSAFAAPPAPKCKDGKVHDPANGGKCTDPSLVTVQHKPKPKTAPDAQ